MKIYLKEKIMSESNEVCYIIFELKENFEFKEWQFVMIETEINWKLLKRAYSIATTNSLALKKQIWFIIKKVSENWMSDFLTKQINIWDYVDITWPFWRLFDTKENQNYLFISAWSGLAPMYSIYKNLLEKWEYWRIVNIFWERFYSNIIHNVINDFQNTENIKNMLFLSKEINSSYNFIKWYVQNWIDEALEFFESNQISIFLCWKPEMVDEIITILINKWFDKNNIKSEKY